MEKFYDDSEGKYNDQEISLSKNEFKTMTKVMLLRQMLTEDGILNYLQK